MTEVPQITALLQMIDGKNLEVQSWPRYVISSSHFEQHNHLRIHTRPLNYLLHLVVFAFASWPRSNILCSLFDSACMEDRADYCAGLCQLVDITLLVWFAHSTLPRLHLTLRRLHGMHAVFRLSFEWNEVGDDGDIFQRRDVGGLTLVHTLVL